MHIEKKMVQKDVFVALDGKEFDCKEECEKYEDDMAKAIVAVDALLSFDVDAPDANGTTQHFYLVTCKDEVEMLKWRFASENKHAMRWFRIPEEEFPAWVCVTEDPKQRRRATLATAEAVKAAYTAYLREITYLMDLCESKRPKA